MTDDLTPALVKEAIVTPVRISVLWEVTQAFIAAAITIARIYTAIHPPTDGGSDLSNAFFLIVGFYFSRTSLSSSAGKTNGSSAGH